MKIEELIEKVEGYNLGLKVEINVKHWTASAGWYEVITKEGVSFPITKNGREVNGLQYKNSLDFIAGYKSYLDKDEYYQQVKAIDRFSDLTELEGFKEKIATYFLPLED